MAKPAVDKAEVFDELLKVCKEIMCLDDSGSLSAMAYSGGDVPKKWMREEAPAIQARADARREIQAMLKPVILKLQSFEEGR